MGSLPSKQRNGWEACLAGKRELGRIPSMHSPGARQTKTRLFAFEIRWGFTPSSFLEGNANNSRTSGLVLTPPKGKISYHFIRAFIALFMISLIPLCNPMT